MKITEKFKNWIAYKRAKKLADKTLKDIGYLIDISMKKFKRYIKRRKLNAGQTKMLIDEFQMLYENMAQRKDVLIEQAKVDSAKKEEIIDAVNRIYLVLMRIEQRILWLRDRYNHLKGEI